MKLFNTITKEKEGIKEMNKHELLKADIIEILKNYSKEELDHFMNEGIRTGLIRELIYYSDTEEFFIKHMDAIMNYMQYTKDICLIDWDNVEISYNEFVWITFELIAFGIIIYEEELLWDDAEGV